MMDELSAETQWWSMRPETTLGGEHSGYVVCVRLVGHHQEFRDRDVSSCLALALDWVHDPPTQPTEPMIKRPKKKLKLKKGKT